LARGLGSGSKPLLKDKKGLGLLVTPQGETLQNLLVLFSAPEKRTYTRVKPCTMPPLLAQEKSSKGHQGSPRKWKISVTSLGGNDSFRLFLTEKFGENLKKVYICSVKNLKKV